MSEIISPYVYPLLKLSFFNMRNYKFLPKSMRMQKEDVIEAIAEEYEIDKSFAFEVGRVRKNVEARQILSNILVFELQMRKTEVGRYLKQDHTTVIHSCKKFDELYIGCNKFKERVDNIYRKLNLKL
jgi:chromosomal replication initiation ATPase DnaA